MDCSNLCDGYIIYITLTCSDIYISEVNDRKDEIECNNFNYYDPSIMDFFSHIEKLRIMKTISVIIDISTNVVICTCKKKINCKITGRCAIYFRGSRSRRLN